MPKVNRQHHLSITGDRNFKGNISLDDFMKNMHSQLEILHNGWDSVNVERYTVFQRKTHRDIDALSRVSFIVKQRIELAHITFQQRFRWSASNLVQFWEPVNIDGRRYLITSELPFSIYNIERGPCSYRKHCMDYRYSADWEDSDTGHLFGPPGRVFLKGTPESSLIIDCSVKEFPLRDYALTCNGDEILFVPVYEPQGNQCIGVVEYIAFDKFDYFIEDVFCSMWTSFQSANLRLKEWPCSLATGDSNAHIGLEKVLKLVCERHYIPFAQVWRPKRSKTRNRSSQYSIVYSVFMQNWQKRNRFYMKCKRLHLKEWQGVVGRAFSSLTSCFCRNLTQLSTHIYPLARDVSKVDLLSSFAVCLRHRDSGYQNFILECFFSNSEITSTNPLELVRSVLDTIKQEFPNLRQASGQELGEDIQILSPFPDYAVDIAPHNCETTLINFLPETGFPRNIEEVVRSSFNKQSEVVIVAPDCLSESNIMSSNQAPPEDGHNINRLQKDIAPGDAEMMWLDQPSRENAHNIDSLLKDIPPAVNAPLDNCQTVYSLEREVRITREVLEQHAVAKLDLVAKHLQVSRSTFKRICRKHRIKNWRSFNKEMAKRMHPDSLTAAEEHIKQRYCRRGDEGFSLSNDNISSGEIVHSVPKVLRIQKGNNVTVKASYEGDMVRFKFSHLEEKITGLVEKLAKRFCLQTNSFKMKYEDEDSDWILLATDEDLTNCIKNVESFRKNVVYVTIENICNVPS